MRFFGWLALLWYAASGVYAAAPPAQLARQVDEIERGFFIAAASTPDSPVQERMKNQLAMLISGARELRGETYRMFPDDDPVPPALALERAFDTLRQGRAKFKLSLTLSSDARFKRAKRAELRALAPDKKSQPDEKSAEYGALYEEFLDEVRTENLDRTRKIGDSVARSQSEQMIESVSALRRCLRRLRIGSDMKK